MSRHLDRLPRLERTEHLLLEIDLAGIEEGHRARMEEEVGMSLSDDKAQEEVEEEAPAAVEQPPVPGAFKVKVDGVEKEVSAEDLIRGYQKNSAADRRLEEAARILRDAEQLAAQQQVAEPEQPQGNLREEAAEMMSKLYDGDQETAAEALVNLLAKTKGGDQPTRRQEVDADVLAEQVLERMAFNSAVERVKSATTCISAAMFTTQSNKMDTARSLSIFPEVLEPLWMLKPT